MTVAPWLRPTDTLGAIQAGAGLGLHLRQQDAAEQSAADQLALAQDQLFSQNQRAAEAVRERQSEAAARLAQSSAQMALTAGHYADAKKLGTASEALKERHQTYLEKLSADHAPTEDPTSISGLPILDAEGNQLGIGVRGKGGAIHVMKPESAAKSLDAKPSDVFRYLSLNQAVLKDPNADDDAKAQARARISALQKPSDAFLNFKLSPQVVTNPPTGFFGKPTVATNYVAGATGDPSPASGAAKVLDRDTAIQLLQQAKGDKMLARKLAQDAGYTIP